MSKESKKADQKRRAHHQQPERSATPAHESWTAFDQLHAEQLNYGLPDRSGSAEIKRAALMDVQQKSGNYHVQRLLNQTITPPGRIVQRDNGRGTGARGRTMARPGARPAPTYAAATNMSEYISLVRALQRENSGLSPRQVLAMLRQVYYGRPWSARTTPQWREVLPRSPMMPDPRRSAGRGPGSLFNVLQQSQEVGGTDIGHILAGLEALLDPTRTLELEVPGPNIIVQMPNTEFATWGGDLGSGAGQFVVDSFLRRRSRGFANYFRQYASDSDLEGDVDAFVIFRGAGGRGGLASMLSGGGSPDQATPVSDILSDYFLSSGSALGQARANRYQTFVRIIGGTVSGSRITNKSALVNPIARRVSSFAYPWFMKEYKNARVRSRRLPYCPKVQ